LFLIIKNQNFLMGLLLLFISNDNLFFRFSKDRSLDYLVITLAEEKQHLHVFIKGGFESSKWAHIPATLQSSFLIIPYSPRLSHFIRKIVRIS
jgi:hypothetical protein